MRAFRGLGAILFKEFIVVLRDPFTLFFMLFPPLIEMIAFGYALDNDVKHMALVVLDQDRTEESRQLVQKFVNTETFRVAGEVQSVAEISAFIRRGKAFAGVQIPPNFTRDLRAGRNAQIQVLIDGSNSTTALQALKTALAVTLRESLLWLFAVPIAGSLTALFVSILVYVFALLSLGLLVSTRAQNQMQALQMSMIFIMPSVFFSGFIFPRETMPFIFYAIGAAIPTTYFIELMRAIILRGASLIEFWHHLAILLTMGLALFVLCALRFRRTIA